LAFRSSAVGQTARASARTRACRPRSGCRKERWARSDAGPVLPAPVPPRTAKSAKGPSGGGSWSRLWRPGAPATCLWQQVRQRTLRNRSRAPASAGCLPGLSRADKRSETAVGLLRRGRGPPGSQRDLQRDCGTPKTFCGRNQRWRRVEKSGGMTAKGCPVNCASPENEPRRQRGTRTGHCGVRPLASAHR
jgi:hypothetical protein